MTSERLAERAVGARIPQSHSPVAGGGGQHGAVAIERQTHSAAGVGSQRSVQRTAGDDVPQPHGPVMGGGASMVPSRVNATP